MPTWSPVVSGLAAATQASLSAGASAPASSLFQYSISWLPKLIGTPHVASSSWSTLRRVRHVGRRIDEAVDGLDQVGRV